MNEPALSAQAACDLIMITLDEYEGFDLIGRQQAINRDCGDERTKALIDVLIKAFDNTYGEGSYQQFHDTVTL